jgi:phenylalanyl-tRNA synthetase beta chain
MKISINLIRYYQNMYHWSGDPAPQGPEALVERIGAQLAGVEEVIPIGKQYEGVLVVRIVSCEDHPNADRLHICKIDDDGKAQDVERDEQGLVQVVCGAPNVRAGLSVAWLQPGATVPNTYFGPDAFVLEARSLRGIVSNGMLASAKELGIGDSHDGILEIDGDVTPGTLFADAFGLRDDVVIDMENKMFTHRPDCFGVMGVAREIAGIQGQAFKSPDWYQLQPSIDQPGEPILPLIVRNELPDLVPRFTAITMRNVAVKPSPIWLQVSLTQLGVRPINVVVDLTNYLMLLLGQPLHAYDYDKVKTLSNGEPTIVVRHPLEGEKIALLNGKEIVPRREAIMIATDKQLIGVGGVMGGADTEVDEHTENIILECATFDMYSIRRTSMAHGLFTDAVTRFNKGQSPLQNLAVLAKAVADMRSLADTEVASPLIDDNHLSAEIMERGSLHAPVEVSRSFINERLGLQLSSEEMRHLLVNVEFDVEVQDDKLTVKAPFWRTDIELPEDVVEEVGRLYGYDKMPFDLPKRDLTPAVKNDMLELKANIRARLSRAGANEVLTYSFVHGNLLDKVGQNRDQAFRLSNALSPDLQYFRQSLTPSLLEKIHPNLKAGNEQFALFETNVVHSKTELDEDGLPLEFARVALVVAADVKATQQFAGAPYYEARKYCADLLAHRGVFNTIHFRSLHEATFAGHQALEQMVSPYEPGRSAVLFDGERIVGVVGEFRPSVRKALKLPNFCAGFELFASALVSDQRHAYVSLPRFPRVEQDICLKVPANTSYQQVFDLVWEHLIQNRPDKTYHTLEPVDIYQRDNDREHKQVTLRLSLASYERTLTDQEVAKLLDAVAAAAHEQLNAERV